MQVTSERSTEDYVLSVDIAKDAAPTTLILKVCYSQYVFCHGYTPSVYTGAIQ